MKNSMKYDIVIFDLDGTILDTLDDLCDSVNFALRENACAERSIDEVRAFVGNGIRLLIERAVPENTEKEICDKVFSDFKEHYKVHSRDKTKPYEGIIPMLEQIRSRGIKTAVVSNKADFAVKELVKTYFEGLFDFSVGEREGILKKPAPDSVFEAISVLEGEKKKCVYVGDSEVDIETAINAGLDCVIVSWGFRDRGYLEKQGATHIVSDVKELLSELTF